MKIVIGEFFIKQERQCKAHHDLKMTIYLPLLLLSLIPHPCQQPTSNPPTSINTPTKLSTEQTMSHYATALTTKTTITPIIQQQSLMLAKTTTPFNTIPPHIQSIPTEYPQNMSHISIPSHLLIAIPLGQGLWHKQPLLAATLGLPLAIIHLPIHQVSSNPQLLPHPKCPMSVVIRSKTRRSP